MKQTYHIRVIGDAELPEDLSGRKFDTVDEAYEAVSGFVHQFDGTGKVVTGTVEDDLTDETVDYAESIPARPDRAVRFRPISDLASDPELRRLCESEDEFFKVIVRFEKPDDTLPDRTHIDYRLVDIWKGKFYDMDRKYATHFVPLSVVETHIKEGGKL